MLYDNVDLGQHWIGWWFISWRQQIIAQTNVDLSPNGFVTFTLEEFKDKWSGTKASTCVRRLHFFHIITHVRWTNGLTHWGRMTHICISKLTIIGSDIGLTTGRRQASGRLLHTSSHSRKKELLWLTPGYPFAWKLFQNCIFRRANVLQKICVYSYTIYH